MVDWCRTKVSQLIDKLRDHPILWDVRCTDDVNKNLKAEALETISRDLHIPIEEVTKKLHSLKVQFSREYCRVRREKLRNGNVYIPKWYGYNQLLFLKDANTRHKKWFGGTRKEENEDYNDYTNSDDLSIVSLNSIKEEYPLSDEDDVEFQPPPPPLQSINQKLHTTYDHSPESPMKNHSMPSTNQSQTSLNQNSKTFQLSNDYHDEFISFGLYLASKLRSINDPYLQALAKHNLNKVIFKIEMKQLQRNNNMATTSRNALSIENFLQHANGDGQST